MVLKHYTEFLLFISMCYGFILISGSFVNQDEYMQDLKDYQYVIPSRVNSDGNHVTFTLHPKHLLRRRSVDPFLHNWDDTLHYKVEIDNEIHLLKLYPNRKLISPGFVIERKKYQFKNVTDSVFSRLHSDHSNCHYHGEIINQSDTKVALGVCNGLHGLIQTENGDYFIEPIKDEPLGSDNQHRHIVYRRSALPGHLDPLSALHVHKRSTHGQQDDSCGTKDYSMANDNRERWEKHHRRKRKTSPDHGRQKRSFSTERYVETLVVVDPSMIKYHKNEHLETYVLTIMNMVAAMFHDASIGNSINIVLVRILLMEEDQEELVITHHADKTLNSFCHFQKMINFKDDDHPNHHDVAILLTRHNICSRLNEPCSTLGLAQVSGMCQPHRSCSINEDTGLALAYTVTHELGHNFGMHHDTSKNGCEDPPGRQLYIMSPSLVADSLTKTWSNCSMNYITTFIDRDWAYCLDDEPVDHSYKFPVLPPGTMYDADHQCRLQYGNDNATICTNQRDVCSNLWCRSDNRCSTHLEAAAEGTICGTNQWCYQGECVKIGDRPEAINGEWGQWTPWTDCTRTCGAGVSHSQRHCDHPAPSHGGKYCLGERKRYRICNTEECADDSVTFNEQQCEDFNYIPYKGHLYEWEHVQTEESPCQLHCKPKGHLFSVLLKDIVTDGTPCTAGTRNMCISGRCRHVGCDFAIDSSAKEDRCGVCHGDGSTCKTIKSQFNESLGLGYVEAAVIPTGARNIRVEEVAAANNFLALQDDKGEYQLNGHWFIQWSGEYKVAGTIVQYKRELNKESFKAAGPLKEPLHIMLLLQSENPGLIFEYTVPKDNISEPRIQQFHWLYQPWTHCTSSCGGGTQRTEVVCSEVEAGLVEDKYCNISTKPDDKQKVCNEHLCPAKWWYGPWQHCSVTCGDIGQHQRTVICIRSLGEDQQIALDDEACNPDDKPAEYEPCNKKDPCPGNSTWITGEWSKCNHPCDVKYRTVTCENPTIGCEQQHIPVSEAQCNDVPCGQWETTDWMQCTETCGKGVQVRKVSCLGGFYCNVDTEPASQRNCSLQPCPTTVQHLTTPTTVLPSTTRRYQQPTSTDPTLEATENNMPDMSIVESSNVPKTTNMAQSVTVSDHITKSPTSINDDKYKAFNNSSDIIADNYQTTVVPAQQNVIGDENKNKKHKNDNSFEIEIVENFNETENENVINDNKDNIFENVNTKSEAVLKEIEQETVTQENIDDSNFIKHEDLNNEKYNSDKDINRNNSTGTNDTNSETDVSSESLDSINDNVNDKTERKHGLLKTEGDKHKNENQLTRHPHRHHHGSTHGKEEDNLNVNKMVKPGEDKTNDNYNILEEQFEDLKGKAEHLPNLPDSNKLSPLPDFDDLPPLPDNMDLPSLPNIKDLAPLPDLDHLPPLPNTADLAPLPNLEDLPPLPNTDKVDKLPNLPSYSKFKELPPLPNAEDRDSLPNLQDYAKYKDLPAINKDDLAALTNIGDLPPMPSIEDLPKKQFLPPLTLTHSITNTVDEGTENAKTIPLTGIKEINNEAQYTASQHHLPPSMRKTEMISINTDGPVAEIHSQTNNEIKGFDDNKNKDINEVIDNSQTVITSNAYSNAHIDAMRLSDVKDDKVLISGGLSDTNMKSNDVAKERVEVGRIYRWKQSEWSECSHNCGGGSRHRTVVCIDNTTNERTGEESCDIAAKPALSEHCNTSPCLEWITSGWSMCSATCGISRKSRRVTCPKSGSCDLRKQPISEQPCDMPACVMWVSGQWSRCNKKCDVGEQVRLVQCVNLTSQLPSRGCESLTKPSERQQCNTQKCQQNQNAALTIKCEHNEMSSIVCRALKKMGQCHKRFVAFKCCRTCNKELWKKNNKNRPRTHALR